MKKIIILSFLLLTPSFLFAQTTPSSTQSPDWSVLTTWNINTVPLDLVHSLDQKRVFILGADHKVHVYTPEGEQLGEIPVDPGVNAIDIAPRGERLFLIDKDSKKFTAIQISFPVTINIAGSPYLGKADAPVTLVVFSDFQCPYCRKIQPIVEKLMEKNPDSLKVVFKNMPLNMHQHARTAALASIAAQEQGKFWQMHDAIFAIDKLSPEKIMEAAQKIGLDMDKFKKDMNSPDTQQRLMIDLRDANMADVSGTPTVFINGRKVMQKSLEDMQSMIDRELMFNKPEKAK